jgi:hypothetical protein
MQRKLTMLELLREELTKEEQDKRSKAIKAGLEKAREQGKILGAAHPGHWKGRRERGFRKAAKASAIARTNRAREHYKVMIELIVKWQAQGIILEIIADRLNRQGFLTLGGCPFTQPAVSSVFRLMGRKPVRFLRIRRICVKCHESYRVSRKKWVSKRCPSCREEGK